MKTKLTYLLVAIMLSSCGNKKDFLDNVRTQFPKSEGYIIYGQPTGAFNCIIVDTLGRIYEVNSMVPFGSGISAVSPLFKK